MPGAGIVGGGATPFGETLEGPPIPDFAECTSRPALFDELPTESQNLGKAGRCSYCLGCGIC